MGAGSSKEAKETKGDVGARYSKPIPVKAEDYSKELPREKLPKDLQNIVDKEESLWDDISEGRYVPRTPEQLQAND